MRVHTHILALVKKSTHKSATFSRRTHKRYTCTHRHAHTHTQTHKHASTQPPPPPPPHTHTHTHTHILTRDHADLRCGTRPHEAPLPDPRHCHGWRQPPLRGRAPGQGSEPGGQHAWAPAGPLAEYQGTGCALPFLCVLCACVFSLCVMCLCLNLVVSTPGRLLDHLQNTKVLVVHCLSFVCTCVCV